MYFYSNSYLRTKGAGKAAVGTAERLGHATAATSSAAPETRVSAKAAGEDFAAGEYGSEQLGHKLVTTRILHLDQCHSWHRCHASSSRSEQSARQTHNLAQEQVSAGPASGTGAALHGESLPTQYDPFYLAKLNLVGYVASVITAQQP